MSLTDKIKKYATGLAIVGAMASNAYGLTQAEFQQMFSQNAKYQYGSADAAFRHGIKNGNNYHVKYKYKGKTDVATVDFRDLDGNGPDEGDELSVVYEMNGSVYKAKTTINNKPYENMAGLRDAFEDNAVIIEGHQEPQ